ncbi:prepilin peptidase [Candidatus Pacearchaeota archaeon]|nr:prepilin peptidase [Candidatus Pacearchaeota archaeon]HIH52415.1 prepilin peptidase [Nanoarchaeota archaeon]
MIELLFLYGLAFIWLIFAVISDIKCREIPNWLNFSLIIFALGFRLFYSLFYSENFSFFLQGIIGFLIFLALANLFYYIKMFAGGDMKLMISLGAVLPIFPIFAQNLKIFFLFILLYLFVGAIYGLFLSFTISIINFEKFRKGFSSLFNINKRFILFCTFFAVLFLFLSFYMENLFFIGILLFFFPYFYLFLKSVDDFCMVRRVSTKKITVGDWLYKDVKIGKKVIRATWDGLSEEDIKLLQKKSEVFLRYGIQFAPVFLISFILLWISLETSWFSLFFRMIGF